MMAQSLLPLGLFTDKKSSYTISGGLFQDFAPNVFHTKLVLLPILERFSVKARIEVVKPGYYPKGGGIIKVQIEPIVNRLTPLRLIKQGNISCIKGIAISSHLGERRVSQRMSDACIKVLARAGYKNIEIKTIDDKSANQKGAALFAYALTDNGCLIGADMAGKLGRRSEDIGRKVAYNLIADIESGATVDRFTADQVILYAGLADGESEYIIPCLTEHVETNLWLIEKILGAKVRLDGKRLKIKGVGITKQ